MRDIESLPDTFTLRRWPDPLVEACGFPVNSIYTETVLLPILGPSTVLCLRRLGAWAAVGSQDTTVDTRQLAGDLGLGTGTARNSPLTRTLNRLCNFDLAVWHHGEMSVRTAVAPLSERHLQRLSPPLLQIHHTLIRQAETRRQHSGARDLERSTVAPSSGVAL